ncbi:hypothetical protein [Jiangella sp. DSM 45060]|uniref:hypothetical protein n=1 Tax=Jiangella sp. DSM 45060 TaxID=1798224 RepID=UPI000879947B|nr:hypothetical protein [Jiangella sp. DSM 45060]SDT35825.1 hypothetical protein SAMN04515669_3700 [Jiangella sp. DSM 45060]
MAGRYANEEHPPQGIPARNQDAIPCFVRLVDAEIGELFKAATARRWTTTHVMVSFEVPGTSPSWPRQEVLAWVRAEDVRRELRRD